MEWNNKTPWGPYDIYNWGNIFKCCVCVHLCVYCRGGYMQIGYETMTFLFILAFIGELHGGCVFEMEDGFVTLHTLGQLIHFWTDGLSQFDEKIVQILFSGISALVLGNSRKIPSRETLLWGG